MTTKSYVTSLMSLFVTLFIFPGMEELIKVYVIAVVIFITIIINVLFRWSKFEEKITNRVYTEVMMKINNKFFVKEIAEVFKEALKEGQNGSETKK